MSTPPEIGTPNQTVSAENTTPAGEWSAREEILHLSHQWPQILLFCLAGCLLGWSVSWLWPSTYRATVNLYVGLNVYQVTSDQPAAEYAGQQFKDFIDYKNWQMSNLNSLFFMPPVIDAALARLRSEEPYWNQVSSAQLSAMLHASWRSAGKWRLLAQDRDALHASQSALAWQASILENVSQSIQASRSLQDLTVQRQANASTLAGLLASQAKLVQVETSFQEQLAKIRSLPPNRPIDELERWFVWQTITQADLGPVWLPLADAFPDATQPASSYVKWMEKAVQAIAQQNQAIQGQIAGLETQNADLSARYAQALQTSMGLSANLEIQAINNKPPELTSLRPTATLILVGGGLALLGWLLSWTIRLSLRGATQQRKAK